MSKLTKLYKWNFGAELVKKLIKTSIQRRTGYKNPSPHFVRLFERHFHTVAAVVGKRPVWAISGNVPVNLMCCCLFFSPVPCVSACFPRTGLTDCTSPSLQQNSLRGRHLKRSSLEGSDTHVGVDGNASPARLESERSSPREVEEDLNKVKSEGGELEEGKDQRGGGEDEERSESCSESEKGDDDERAKVNEECCGGDEEEEEIQEGEELENLSERSKSDGSSRKMEAECFVAKQNEIAHGRSRDEEKEEADSQEEKVKLEEMKEGSESVEDLERCSLSNSELKACDGEGAASSLEREGGITEAGASDLDESAAVKPQTSQLCDVSGSAGVHPADLTRVSEERESLAGSLTAEVGLRFGSRVLSPRRLASPPLSQLLFLLPACNSVSSASGIAHAQPE